jgi:hypothetical protein
MIGTFPKGTYIDMVLIDVTGIMSRRIFIFTSRVRVEIFAIGTVMEDTVRSPLIVKEQGRVKVGSAFCCVDCLSPAC